jgi:hypothetical protein
MTSPTQAEMEDIAERAATKAVHSVLTTLGIDITHPFEAQRDFQTLRDLTKLAADPEFRKDLEHIRMWRKRTEAITIKGMLALATAVVGGLLTAVWYGVQAILNLPRPPY